MASLVLQIEMLIPGVIQNHDFGLLESFSSVSLSLFKILHETDLRLTLSVSVISHQVNQPIHHLLLPIMSVLTLCVSIRVVDA